jgi:hypothetical protein
VETTQPVDDLTHDFSAGLELDGKWVIGRLAYGGSLYRNDEQSLTWDNPFRVGPAMRGATNVERGRFALAPDNDWHNAKGEVALELPLDGRLAATLSWSRMRQDAELLPPTVNSGVVGAPPTVNSGVVGAGSNAVNLGLWNTRAALGEGSADAAVGTWLANADLRVRPWRPLRLGARFRYFRRKNHTDYTAFNPSTGQIGYIAEDGALEVGTPLFSRVFRPGQPSDDWRYRSTPYGYDQIRAEAQADWELRERTTLGLAYAWEELGHDHRERDRTREQRVRAELSSRQLPWATARFSYEYATRGGSSYRPDPYRSFYVSSLRDFRPLPGPPPFTLAQLRKSDLADRSQHLARLQLNLLVREDTSLFLAGSYVDDRYDADYGLEFVRLGSASLEWSVQPSPAWDAYLFGGFEAGRRRLANINDVFPTSSSDPNAGGPVFPLANAWTLETTETGGNAGAGFRWRLLDRLTLESAYSFLLTRQRLDYDFASAGALAPGVTAAQAGSRFPELRTVDHVLQSSVRLELSPRVALRIFHLFQRERLDDFQQQGLEAGLVGGALFLGHVDGDYQAHVVGATAQLRF